ncbi:MAG: hypothetical protein H7A46_23080 [Verrucomicrobiales bacterium]|nr:hypothetical protein [Verrucomicrobiales bacterium]
MNPRESDSANHRIVSRHMEDRDFGDAAFALLSRVISDWIPKKEENA